MSEPHPHCDLETICRIYHVRTHEYRRDKPCGSTTCKHDSRKVSASKQGDAEQRIRDIPKFTSEDLILLAHDEWKRREERKHLHNEGDWIAGFLNGFCTSRKWARETVDKIRKDGKAIALLRRG